MNFIKNFNGLELLFIIILAILVFGPEKIPEIAAKLGSWARTLRRLSNQIMEDINKETGLSDLDLDQDQVSSSLNQTAAEMKSTVQAIRSPVNSFKESLQGQVVPENSSEGSDPDKVPEPTTKQDLSSQKEILEKRLISLEQEIQTIRSELEKDNSQNSENSND